MSQGLEAYELAQRPPFLHRSSSADLESQYRSRPSAESSRRPSIQSQRSDVSYMSFARRAASPGYAPSIVVSPPERPGTSMSDAMVPLDVIDLGSPSHTPMTHMPPPQTQLPQELDSHGTERAHGAVEKTCVALMCLSVLAMLGGIVYGIVRLVQSQAHKQP